MSCGQRVSVKNNAKTRSVELFDPSRLPRLGMISPCSYLSNRARAGAGAGKVGKTATGTRPTQAITLRDATTAR
jgi:hypothetical protein